MQSEKKTFKKAERLKSRNLISELFNSGKIIHSYPLKLLYSVADNENQEFNTQFAVSVSKKNHKNAVARNRIKRKIREGYRHNKHLLYKKLEENNKYANLFVIYASDEDLHYSVIEKGIKGLIVKIAERLS